MPPTLLAPPYKKVMIKTEGGHSITLDDTPGIGGITLETSGGQKIVNQRHWGSKSTTGKGAHQNDRTAGLGQQRRAGRDLMPGFLLHPARRCCAPRRTGAADRAEPARAR